MTAYTATGAYIPHGINEQNMAMVEVVIPSTMSSSDTLAVQLPGGNLSVSPAGEPDTISQGDQAPIDFDSLPVATALWDTLTNAGGTPALLKASTVLPITNHNQSTGVTTLTAGAGVTAGWKLIIWYQQAQ